MTGLRACVCGCATLVVVLPARAAQEPSEDLAAAIHAFDLGQDLETLSLADALLSTELADGDRGEARFTAARAALDLGESELALTYLNGLEGYLPEVADYVVSLRAQAYRQAGLWVEALQVWQHLGRQFPTSPLAADALLGMADAYLALDQLPEARASYLSAIRRLPQSSAAAIARYNVAMIDARSGRLADAAWGYTYLGYHRAADSVSDMARERLLELVKAGKAARPSHRTLLARLDRLLIGRRLDQARPALEELRATVQTAEQEEATAFRAAELYYYERNFEQAIPAFEALSARTGPRQLTYQSWLGKTLSAAGDLDRAITTYRDIADRHAGRREARDALFKAAWLCFNARQHDRALKLFAEFLTRYPRDRHADEALWYSTWNSYRLGDLPNALAILTRLKHDYPDSELFQRALYWEGRFDAQLGRMDDAMASYSAAVTFEPLSYYAMMARERLRDFGAGPELARTDGVMFAALTRPADVDDEMSDVPPEPPEPAAEELPEAGGYVGGAGRPLPWGGSVIDWSAPEGQRAMRLIHLGLRKAAVDLVANLPDLPGQEPASATFARARLYYALGAFDRAHRLASIAFARELRGEPRGPTRAYFRLAYPPAHEGLVEHAAAEFKTSPWLILSIMRQESAFRPEVRSPMNARGLMQILPTTGERIADALDVAPFTSEMLNDPEVAVRFGAWYLSALSNKFRGHPVLTISAYNAGPTVVAQWVARAGGALSDEFVEEIPFRETRGYVRHVLGNMAVYTALYGAAPVEIPDRLPTQCLPEPSF